MSDNVNNQEVAESTATATAAENTASVVNEANGAVAGKADPAAEGFCRKESQESFPLLKTPLHKTY